MAGAGSEPERAELIVRTSVVYVVRQGLWLAQIDLVNRISLVYLAGLAHLVEQRLPAGVGVLIEQRQQVEEALDRLARGAEVRVAHPVRAPPLVLDLMELFRVPMVDMALIGALNRGTFDAAEDFEQRGAQVWLAQSGRQKAIELFERRKQDEWRHSVVNYSLSYARLIELEVRLLEKEWSGEGQLFARFRLR